MTDRHDILKYIQDKNDKDPLLLLGDSLNILSSIPENSIDCIILVLHIGVIDNTVEEE